MEVKKIYIVLAIALFMIGCIYAYLSALGSMWILHEEDDSPYFITTSPIVLHHILVPQGTKITYANRYFWQKKEQNRMLNEKYITEISLPEGSRVEWGGVPITSIIKFYNPDMKGYSVYADFDRLHKDNETQFAKLWQGCSDNLSITVTDTDDWSFNKNNIVDIESCSVNFQRYFKEDLKQQNFLDSLHDAMMQVKE